MAIHSSSKQDRIAFTKGSAPRKLLILNAAMSILYFLVITFGIRPGNHLLFYLLIAGEVFHLFQILGYLYTIWDTKVQKEFDPEFQPEVDIFITVAGEPVDIVETTARAALAMDYPNFHVYLLNDGFVAKKENWREIDALARKLGISSITRRKPGGAKAGNINNALAETKSPYVVIFDADHVPYTTFLKETMGYFVDNNMGFVQTPQYYHNQHLNKVTDAAWSQQALFFGPIMSGKNRTNSAFMCGTNMILNRRAVIEAGGMCEFNIAEDFLTSLFVHDKGWNSYYLPKVLAEGLAPEDFLSYYKQQFRWTRGSLEVIFKYNPLFRRGLTFSQRMQYLISASYFLSGITVVYDAVLPMIFLFTGLTAVTTATMTLAMFFIPYIFITLFTLQLSSNFAISYQAMAFSISAFFLQLRGIAAVVLGQKTSFSVTSKQQVKGNFLYLTTPHIVYVVLAAVGLYVGLSREGLDASLLANLSWVVVNIVFFVPFIVAASPYGNKSPEDSEISPPPEQPPHRDSGLRVAVPQPTLQKRNVQVKTI